MKNNIKIAIVHDYLTKLGGAEKVLAVFSEMYPKAPVYTLLYDEEGTNAQFKNKRIICSSLQKLPGFIRKRPKFLLPFLPKAIEKLDLSSYDIVISSSNAYAHNIITPKGCFHLCYCYSPMRYVWDWYHEYLKENNIGWGLKGLIVRIILFKIRLWDKIYSTRASKYIAISDHVKNRIKKYYRQEAEVIYSPVDVSSIKLTDTKPKDYYLIVSRLEPYKKIDLAIKTFNKNGKKLKIIGVGSQLEDLKKMANSNIEFLGWQSDESVIKFMQDAKAFVFPGEEDYGLTPIESMACGRPVVAYNKGGVKETVVDDKTGVFFDDETNESLQRAIDHLEKNYSRFTPKACREQAEKFSKENFVKQFDAYLNKEYSKFSANK